MLGGLYVRWFRRTAPAADRGGLPGRTRVLWWSGHVVATLAAALWNGARLVGGKPAAGGEWAAFLVGGSLAAHAVIAGVVVLFCRVQRRRGLGG